MRSVTLGMVVVAVGGCGGSSERGSPDAAPSPGDGVCECFPDFVCTHGQVDHVFSRGLPCTYANACGDTYTCTNGCTVDTRIDTMDVRIGNPPLPVFCAETPSAQVGDPCGLDDDCLPTRAETAADGSVTQAYLACDFVAHTCAAAPAPVVPGYLAPCPASAATVAAGPNVYGMVSADADGLDSRWVCLVAWDAGASALVSGVTVPCSGDWDCPDGALCDDRLPRLTAAYLPAPLAVCRPGGPRGAALDPARIHP